MSPHIFLTGASVNVAAGLAPVVLTMLASCTSVTTVRELRRKDLLCTGPRRHMTGLRATQPGGGDEEQTWVFYWGPRVGRPGFHRITLYW